MKTCEWHCVDLRCDKLATFRDIRGRAFCGSHADDVEGRIPLDAETLAHLLSEELESDNWGDVDPDLFRQVAKPDPDASIDPTTSDAAALCEVLTRVAERWNKGDL